MVHALEQTRNILHSNGLLISIHDLPTPHVIEVHTPEHVTKVGWLLDGDDFAETRSALNALAQAVADGDFVLEDQQDFDYNIYLDDLPELQEWLSAWWESAVLADKVILRLEELTQYASQPTRIVLAMRARMTKLRAA